jgi:hypothetical protein
MMKRRINRKGHYYYPETSRFKDMKFVGKVTKYNDIKRIWVYDPNGNKLCSIIKGQHTHGDGVNNFEVWFSDEEDPRSRVTPKQIIIELDKRVDGWYQQSFEWVKIPIKKG